jgi:hypothetical protein
MIYLAHFFRSISNRGLFCLYSFTIQTERRLQSNFQVGTSDVVHDGPDADPVRGGTLKVREWMARSRSTTMRVVRAMPPA